MSGPPWMKYSPRDFVGDTQHLTCEERGAYIALINHYWINGGLPEDDARLCRIVGLDEMRWQCVRNAMTSLFRANWRHKRIDEELSKAVEKSHKATSSANNRWKDKQKTKNANAIRLQQCERNANKITDTDSKIIEANASIVDEPLLALADPVPIGKSKDEVKAPLMAFGEAWNELASSFRLPTIDEIKPGSTRERHALARLREMPEGVPALMARIRGSPYLRGEVNGFRCTFDWIVNASNFQKIMEGNYEDRKGTSIKSGHAYNRNYG